MKLSESLPALVTGVLLLTATAAFGADDDPAGELLEIAAAALDAGETKRALKLYEQAARAPEHRVGALLGIARVHNRLRRRDKALATAEAAAESAGSAGEEAAARNLIGLVQANQALDILIEVERLSARPGKKKPSYREQVDEHLALSEASYRRALELTDGALPVAWRNLVELLSDTGRFQEARDELVRYFEHDPDGRSSAADLLAHLECVGDVADLIEIARPGDAGVSPAAKQFHPSPRWSGEDEPGAARAVGVVDREGRFRCVRMVNAAELPAGAAELFLSTLAIWRFQPATLEGERVAAFHGETVEVF